jgi:dTDP-4-amino-4,6-dideoxygalactose transaminase
MIDLIPTEALEYKSSDIIRGLSAALSHQPPYKALYIDGIGDCIPTRSARTAIIIALKALNLRAGARIGVPLYCCPVVFKAIKVANCVPIFIDCDSKTFCISAEDLSAKSAELDALIAVHMFGNVCDMPNLRKTMNRKPIIEDCAQSLGSRLNGRLAGSFGNIAFFSFRLGKYLSAGEGGALFSDDADLCARMLKLAVNLPTSTHIEELKHVLENYIRSNLRNKPLWGIVGSSIWREYNKKTDFISKSPIILSQIFKSDLAIVRNRLAFLDSMIKANRDNAEYYMRNLQLEAGLFCSESPRAFYNRLMFPITFRSSEDRNKIAGLLRQQQISVSKPYEEVIEGAARYYGYEGDCPTAEQLLRRTLVIPSHYKLKKKELGRITKCINEAWEKITNEARRH